MYPRTNWCRLLMYRADYSVGFTPPKLKTEGHVWFACFILRASSFISSRADWGTRCILLKMYTWMKVVRKWVTLSVLNVCLCSFENPPINCQLIQLVCLCCTMLKLRFECPCKVYVNVCKLKCLHSTILAIVHGVGRGRLSVKCFLKLISDSLITFQQVSLTLPSSVQVLTSSNNKLW